MALSRRFSNPSGMRETPEEVIVVISFRGTARTLPSAWRTVTVLALSPAMRPKTDSPAAVVIV